VVSHVVGTLLSLLIFRFMVAKQIALVITNKLPPGSFHVNNHVTTNSPPFNEFVDLYFEYYWIVAYILSCLPVWVIATHRSTLDILYCFIIVFPCSRFAFNRSLTALIKRGYDQSVNKVRVDRAFEAEQKQKGLTVD